MVLQTNNQSTQETLSIFKGHQFLSLTTFRQNGDAVTTPVWFAQVGEKLYIMTMRSSGKAKRISHTPRVRIAPCDRVGMLLGESIDAEAHLIDNDEQSAADAALSAKYGEQKTMFDARMTDPNDRVFIVVTAA
jgi:PPOX class probable F420-dependent enzyme